MSENDQMRDTDPVSDTAWNQSVGANVGSGDGAEAPKPPVFKKDRDLDAARRALEPWFCERLGRTGVRIVDFAVPAGAGVSNETLLLTLDPGTGAGDPGTGAGDPGTGAGDPGTGAGTALTECVVRIHPRPEYQLFMNPEFELQFQMLDVLHRNDLVKVSKTYWYEPDESLLGLPFFVVERLHGNVPVSMPVYNSSGWLYDATPAQRRIVWETAVTEFARIHQVPTELVEFVDRPQWGRTGVEQKINYWTHCLEWATHGQVPEIMLTIRQWLVDNVPEQLERSLAWGDARMGNMMFGPDFRLVGVNDWEQANLSGPMQDLGWWLFFDDYHSVDHGLARLDGLGTREETIELWQDLAGMKAHDIGYYEVLSGYELTTLTLRTIDLATTAGAMPVKPPLHFLYRTCAMLDLEVPAQFRTAGAH